MPTRRRATSQKHQTDHARDESRLLGEDHERMVLRGADREVFLNAIANPGRPGARLVAALRKHRKLAAEP
jgi:uncharacterized protein (DUF1778 family)